MIVKIKIEKSLRPKIKFAAQNVFILPALDPGRFLPYFIPMHEMSLTASLLNIIKEEMAKAGKTRLIRVTLRYGVLSHVLPEAMSTAFELLTESTPLAGAELILLEEPATLACSGCDHVFSPTGRRDLFMPCPSCGRELGHQVITGKGLYLESMEVE